MKILVIAAVGLLLGTGASPDPGSSGAAPASPWVRVSELRLVNGSTLDTGMRVVLVSRNGARRVVASSRGWTALSPDGRYRAWYAHSNGETRILTAPTGGGTPRILAASACASPLHACATDAALVWSHRNVLAFLSHADVPGSKVTLGFASSDGTVLHQYSYPSTNAVGRQLNYFLAAWSPNGRRLVFVRSEFDGPKDVFVADSRSWAVRRVFRAAHFKDHPVAAWSPDSRSLAIVTQGWDRARDPAYAVVDVAAGRPTVRKSRCEIGPACPSGGGVVWSPDGREVAYATLTGIARARRDLSAAMRVFETSTPPELRHWTRDGLIAIDWSARKVAVIRPVAGSVPRTIYSTPRGWQPAAVAVAMG